MSTEPPVDGVENRVGVVGAGITGLSLVHFLERAGRDVVCFEARDRPGGVVHSDELDGVVVEYGPNRIRETDPVAELIDDVGLRGQVIVADDDLPLYVYHRGTLRVVPRSIGEFLRTNLLSWRGKARVLYEPFTAPAEGDERVADLFTRKFGAEAYRNVVEPLFSGIYASDPAAMPARHSLSRLLSLERTEGSLLRPALRRARKGSGAPPISFTSGLGALPEAIYQRHRERVHLERGVERITRSDGGYRIETISGPEVVEDVVVTAPATDAADVLEDLAADAAGCLRQLRYNPIAMVYLRADLDREGFGYQVHGDEDLRTRGVTFNASLFDRDGLYTAFLGGMTDPEVLEESDAQLAAIAEREFEEVLGVMPEVLGTNRVHAYPAYDTTWAALDDLELPEGIHLATNYTARIGVPSRIREAKQLAEKLS